MRLLIAFPKNVERSAVVFEVDAAARTLTACAVDDVRNVEARGVWVKDARDPFGRSPALVGLPGGVFTARQAGRRLHQLERAVGEMIDRLAVVGDGFDWSVAAAAAWRQAAHMAAAPADGDVEALPDEDAAAGLVDFWEAWEHLPGITIGLDNVLGLSEEALEEAARHLSDRTLPPTGEVVAYAASRGWEGHSLYLVGARAGLHDLRARQEAEASGQDRVVDAADHYRGRELPLLVRSRFSASVRDSDVEFFAGLLRDSAARRGVSLTGTVEFLAGRRAEMRQEQRARMRQVAELLAFYEDEVRRLRNERAFLLGEVLDYRDPAEYDEEGRVRLSAVARTAGMSKQGLAQFLDRTRAADI